MAARGPLRRIGLLLLPVGILLSACGTSRELLLAGPLKALPDRQPVPEPEPATPNQYYDFASRTVFRQVHSWFDVPRHVRWLTGNPKQAVNVDAFDEVGDSAWFTNRGALLTREEALRGPDTVDGPDRSSPWRVRGVKTQGVTPGFRIKDARGDTYLLKFDPNTNPEMASGAEIVSTKLAWAVGYNTPENHLVFFTADDLAIEDDVTIRDEMGVERTLTRTDVEGILERVPRAPDGRIRAVASKFLPGKPMGPYSYLGTRDDDPNDVFRHEHRRELRGLYVFASWVNHNDVRRINSLDMYSPGGFLTHYLIDFGSTLGSASVAANLPSEGFEHQVDFSEMGKSLVTLGLRKRPWQRVELRSDPAVGYFGAEGFDPGHWKPNYPNLAFQRLTDRDGFWGAKQVMSLDDETIRGIVAQARYSDPAVEQYMAETLIRRRDAVGRHWYGRVNPLDRFEVSDPAADGQVVRFADLAVEAGFESAASTSYRYELLHNDFGGRDETLIPGSATSVAGIRLAPETLDLVEDFCTERGLSEPEDRLFYLRIHTRRDDSTSPWTKAHLLLRPGGEGFRLAGVERED